MKTLFITNANSGRRRDMAAIEKSIRRLYGPSGREFAVTASHSKDDLDRLVGEAESSGVEIVFAVGGDGTVNEIGRRVAGTAMILGILPIGSGNGLARHLGIPMKIDAAIAAAAACRTEIIDTAVAGGLVFLGTFGVGFDAEVAHRFAASATRGLQTYVREGAVLLATYDPQRYSLRIEDREVEEEAFIVTVANSNQYGNEARVAPLASLQDGLLDISVIRKPPLLSAPLLMQQLFSGHLDQSPHVTMYRAARIRIRREAPGPAHIDGEPVMMGQEIEVTVRPGSLKVLVPEKAGKI